MFTPIDLNTWPRRDHFKYYRTILPVGHTMTVRLDVTRFRAMLEKQGLKFYPSFIWCVSHNILSHPAFRMAVDQEGNPGTHDVLHPNYTIFHEDDHTFSDIWTEHSEDFGTFYRGVQEDLDTFGQNHGVKIKPGQPWNFYCISCIPWTDFTGYSATVAGSSQANLFPIFTYGKAVEEADGRVTMPIAINIAHAAADGWHIAEFFNHLQELLDSITLSL